MGQPTDLARLSDYVRRRMRDANLTAEQVAHRASRQGRRISDSYVAKVVQAKAGDLTVPKLQALATGLGVSEDELFDVVRGVTREDFRKSYLYALEERRSRLHDDRHIEIIGQMLDAVSLLVEKYLIEEAGGGRRDTASVRESGLV